MTYEAYDPSTAGLGEVGRKRARTDETLNQKPAGLSTEDYLKELVAEYVSVLKPFLHLIESVLNHGHCYGQPEEKQARIETAD